MVASTSSSTMPGFQAARWATPTASRAGTKSLPSTRPASFSVPSTEEMAKSGGGAIVNISSIMGFVGGASGHPAYCASKGAVRIYTKAAAVRYGPLGIRVNSVHPGYLPPMLNATNAGERDDKIALTPLRRLGKPIEVAYGVLFLASDEASFVTGTELVIDGGYIAQ